MSTGRCQVCQKTVYAMEKLSAENKVFHKNCFKCSMCKAQLSLGKYASMDFKYFCKPCFKKTFFLKGNYSEGFGKLKPQQQWAASQGSVPGQDDDDILFTEAEEREIEDLVNNNTLDQLKAILDDLVRQEKELVDAKA